MIEKLSREQYLEYLKKLPEDLQEALYAQEVNEKIDDICHRNKIEGMEKYLNTATSDLYLGLLPPDKFKEDLEKQLAGKPGIGQTMYEIDNFLVRPWRASIEKIYNIAPAAAEKKEEASPGEEENPKIN